MEKEINLEKDSDKITDKKKKKDDWTFKEFISYIILVFIVVLPIRIFVAQPFIVSGDSMEPTFSTGEYLIVDQLTYHIEKPRRGDVIIFRLAEEKNRYLIKRLIALPGETIKIKEEEIFIKENDGSEYKKIEQDFIKYPKSSNLQITLEEDQYFVLGDNRVNSADSRIFGPINEDSIVGRAMIRLFPLTEINWMPGKVKF